MWQRRISILSCGQGGFLLQAVVRFGSDLGKCGWLVGGFARVGVSALGGLLEDVTRRFRRSQLPLEPLHWQTREATEATGERPVMTKTSNYLNDLGSLHVSCQESVGGRMSAKDIARPLKSKYGRRQR